MFDRQGGLLVLLVRVLVGILVGVLAGVLAGELAAALCLRLLEDLEVAVLGSQRACLLVPGAPVGPRPLEDREAPSLSGVSAQATYERAPLP